MSEHPNGIKRSVGERFVQALPLVGLIVGSILYHLPALINFRGVHSDAAIVGLQARHILRGEWSWFLWGAGYQASIDAALLAVAFALMGANAFTLMLVPFLAHLALVGVTYSILRRHLTTWSAFLTSLPLVFTPEAINRVALYAPRQWAITSVFLAFWFLDRASRARRPWLNYVAGLFLGIFSLYLDLYTLQFMLGFGVFALLCTLDGRPQPRVWLGRAIACAIGSAVGLFLVSIMRHLPAATSSATEFSLQQISGNFNLLWNVCLPFVLGAKVFIPGSHLYPDLWEPPFILRVFQALGAISLLAAILLGGISVLRRVIPWEVRRLGLLGLIVAISSIAGFLVSSMPSDMWSARYLAPIVWTAPFALAPLAATIPARVFGLSVAPYLIVAAIGGWLSYGPYVHGILPALDARGTAQDERKLGEFLRQRGVTAASAQYWLSYRLTFLFEENPAVVPLNPNEDRYPPYREVFEQSKVAAFIFHPSEPRAQPEPYEQWFRRHLAKYERLEIAGFTVLIFHR